MSSFFIQDAEAIIYKHIDSYPLLKIQRLLDWNSIEKLLAGKKIRYVRDNGGRPAYPLLPMFKAVLLVTNSIPAPTRTAISRKFT